MMTRLTNTPDAPLTLQLNDIVYRKDGRMGRVIDVECTRGDVDYPVIVDFNLISEGVGPFVLYTTSGDYFLNDDPIGCDLLDIVVVDRFGVDNSMTKARPLPATMRINVVEYKGVEFTYDELTALLAEFRR